MGRIYLEGIDGFVAYQTPIIKATIYDDCQYIRSGPSTALRASLTSNFEGLLWAWVGYGMMDVFDFTQDISG